MSKYEMRKATYSDSVFLNRLIAETPQDNDVVINFERHPCFFDGTNVATTDPCVWVYNDTLKKRLIGVFSIGYREIYINGEKTDICYANDLRIHPDYRGTRSLVVIFKKVRELLPKNNWMQTVILAENHLSISTVGSGRAGLPTYYPFGEIKTYLISTLNTGENAKSSLIIRQAKKTDIDDMQAFFNQEAPKKQFYPYYEFAKVSKDESYYKDIKLEDYFLAFEDDCLVGISGIWDQKSFKQTRFVHYKGKMRWLRYIYNTYARLFGEITLPKAGDVLNFVYLHNTVTKNNRTDIFEALFAKIYQYCKNNNIPAIVSGFSIKDDLCLVLEKYKKKTMLSKQFLVSWDGDPRTKLDQSRIPYVDLARL